jgi:ArsR family transcriptional regulator, arsenate/arsenite/antimonite-responsive transcriptional repressor / arsenate reductase (thioredoxin)
MDTHDADRLRVLFVCTRNSARSQMAEALLRHLSRGRIDVFSAGSEPAESVHPLVAEAVGELTRADLADARPKPLSLFAGERFEKERTSKPFTR